MTRLICGVLLLSVLTGCNREKGPPVNRIRDKPVVKLATPEKRTIKRTIGQPSFVVAYEQTAIFAKLAAYIEKWNVDINDLVKKGDLLVTLFIPELLAEHDQKKALVEQDKAMIDQAERLVEVANGQLQAASAQVAEAQANVAKFQAEVERWDSEVKRLTQLVKEKVVDKQVLDESIRQLKANTASREAAKSQAAAAVATELAARAALGKARVDVEVAKARARVSDADERRLAALVGYTQLRAPYAGVVVARNANTGDFVLPATGDPSASARAPDVSSAKAAPIYVIARTDVVRIYVDVTEADADSVAIGSKARVRIEAFQHEEIPAKVTRTSWALNVSSRTLRAEIDLPNPDAKIRPGMYAYGMIDIERDNVTCVPAAALTDLGNNKYCYVLENGKAVRTQIQVGVSDGEWTEVIRKKTTDKAGAWVPLTGKERVVLADLTELADGQAVEVAE
jgi:multidrug efflux pump subunit AcrA (membrane-fusion protein)